jgi:hypothetical protein
MLIHNTPTMWKLALREEVANPSVKLRGFCWYEGEQVFRTSLSQQYPPDLSKEYGALASECQLLSELADVAETSWPSASDLDDHCLPSLVGFGSEDEDDEPVLGNKMLGFVPNGAGAVYGLTIHDHILWTESYVPVSTRKSPKLSGKTETLCSLSRIQTRTIWN